MEGQMGRAISMFMKVKMDSFVPQPPEQIAAEDDQHDSNCGLQPISERRRYRMSEQQRRPGKRKKRNRVAEPPGQAVLDDFDNIGTACSDAGDGSNVIGLKGMLHAQ